MRDEQSRSLEPLQGAIFMETTDKLVERLATKLGVQLEPTMTALMAAGISTSFFSGIVVSFIGFTLFNFVPAALWGLVTASEVNCQLSQIQEKYMVCASDAGEEVFVIRNVRVLYALNEISPYSNVTINVRGIGIFDPKEVTGVMESTE